MALVLFSKERVCFNICLHHGQNYGVFILVAVVILAGEGLIALWLFVVQCVDVCVWLYHSW